MKFKLLYPIFFFICISSVTVAQEPQLILPVGHVRDINGVSVSPDENLIATASNDRTVKVWARNSGLLLASLENFGSWVHFTKFSPDGKKLMVSSGDKNISIFDNQTLSLLYKIQGFKEDVLSGEFSPDSKSFLTIEFHKNLKLWDAGSGKLLRILNSKDADYEKAIFTPDGKIIIASIPNFRRIELFDLLTQKVIKTFNAGEFKLSDDGKWIAMPTGHGAITIFDLRLGTVAQTFMVKSLLQGMAFTPDNNDLMIYSYDSCLYQANLKSGDIKKISIIPEQMNLSRVDESFLTSIMLFNKDGKQLYIFNPSCLFIYRVDLENNLVEKIITGHTSAITGLVVFKRSESILTVSRDKTGIIRNTKTKAVYDLKGHNNEKYDPGFSKSGKFFYNETTTAKWGGEHTIELWNTTTGKKILSINGGEDGFMTPTFTKDEEFMFVYVEQYKTYKVFQTATGKMISTYTSMEELDSNYTRISNNDYQNTAVSPDGTKKLTQDTKTCTVTSVKDNKVLLTVTSKDDNNFSKAAFSNDGKNLIISSFGNTTRIINSETGVTIKSLPAFIFVRNLPKHIIAAINKQTIDFYSDDKFELLYKVAAIDSSDYLVIDKDNHYDGTERARKLLYFTCGTEIIGLDQVKDQLWVPNLAERIMNGEKISAPKLNELNICGLTPLVEPIPNKTGYQFRITPQRGGLGSTILYLNNIETLRFEPSQLKKASNYYELFVPKAELKPYFCSGASNHVTVQAYISQNDIASRSGDGDDGEDDVEIKDTTPPNLFAVFVGVSDYKGQDLDLKFAAKDAADLSNAVNISAAKLLGKPHVFIYNLNTGIKRDALPEKNRIIETFKEIGKKALANDILLIFFAGHGLIDGDNKQFYFLSADASGSTASGAGLSNVGISSVELMEWIKPANIKAQKRILILDACHSGSAINQMVSIGKDQGYLATRNDDKAQEIKQIDKLNQKSGMYVLAASAGNQLAYELGSYNQGILTFALLKAIKEHPEVLEQSIFLNVSAWFNMAVKIVSDLVSGTKMRQEPQLITTTNFNIGVVDNEVLTSIILPSEKPLFVASSFQNSDAAVAYDDLEIGKNVNMGLNDVNSRGVDGAIAYTPFTDSPDAFLINGQYEIKGEAIIVKINIKQNKDKAPKYRFECKGVKSDLKTLSDLIITKTLSLIH